MRVRPEFGFGHQTVLDRVGATRAHRPALRLDDGDRVRVGEPTGGEVAKDSCSCTEQRFSRGQDPILAV